MVGCLLLPGVPMLLVWMITIMSASLPPVNAEKPTILILAAPPASGKGTMSAHLAASLHIPHLSTGDMLRSAVHDRSAVGMKAEKAMKEGLLVDDSTVNAIVRDRIAKADCARGFILDGYPRTVEQAESLDQTLKTRGISVSVVLNIEMPLEAEQECIAGRWVSQSGDSYNANPRCLHGRRPKSLPVGAAPICQQDDLEHCNMRDDSTGEPLYRRSDDNPDVLVKRANIYRKETEPILSYYADIVRQVNGNQPETKVLEKVYKILEEDKEQAIQTDSKTIAVSRELTDSGMLCIGGVILCSVLVGLACRNLVHWHRSPMEASLLEN
eukprot:TRINITY_DN30915_c0_g1_i1.p1 TRINITY_DN30915_c0_g1~~TRINITY_DN30915_c0_g1_i1.p1  ORF type:complete len:340 (-),score=37.09 TRINITY_DN30915_c0_g1_i1:142-1119(-)